MTEGNDAAALVSAATLVHTSADVAVPVSCTQVMPNAPQGDSASKGTEGMCCPASPSAQQPNNTQHHLGEGQSPEHFDKTDNLDDATTTAGEQAENDVKVVTNGGLTKSAAKKLARRQRFLEARAAKKAARKEQHKQALAAKRDRCKDLPDEEREARIQGAKQRKLEKQQATAAVKQKLQQALKEGMVLVYDLAFWELMTDAEKNSMRQQIMMSYSANRNADTPCHMCFTSCSDSIRDFLRETISGFDSWKVTVDAQPYIDRFAERTQDLVYLTADADEQLEAIDPSKVYIIGAFVDRNRHKNICYDKASEQGIGTASLPLKTHIELAACPVLTVNQVTEIMVKQVREYMFKYVAETVPLDG